MPKIYDRKDEYYKAAKAAGVRSRAYFKLKELNDKYKIFKPGQLIADLGAWPGSWIEYVLTQIGKKGKIVGVDISEIEPFRQENVHIITADLYLESTLAAMKEHFPEGCDHLISDLSPKLVGIKESDRAICAALYQLVMEYADAILKPGGTVILKVFKSQETEDFVKRNRTKFAKINREDLDSTRKTSKEFYLVGVNFKKTT